MVATAIIGFITYEVIGNTYLLMGLIHAHEITGWAARLLTAFVVMAPHVLSSPLVAGSVTSLDDGQTTFVMPGSDPARLRLVAGLDRRLARGGHRAVQAPRALVARRRLCGPAPSYVSSPTIPGRLRPAGHQHVAPAELEVGVLEPRCHHARDERPVGGGVRSTSGAGGRREGDRAACQTWAGGRAPRGASPRPAVAAGGGPLPGPEQHRSAHCRPRVRAARARAALRPDCTHIRPTAGDGTGSAGRWSAGTRSTWPLPSSLDGLDDLDRAKRLAEEPALGVRLEPKGGDTSPGERIGFVHAVMMAEMIDDHGYR